jgi:L-gulonate 5-dehydrogenase
MKDRNRARRERSREPNRDILKSIAAGERGAAMWAVSVQEPDRLKLLQTEPPSPEPDEVLVRIGRAGICGSDMHIYRGKNPFARYPRVIGHEAMGRIEAIGARVTGLAVGDRVVLDPVVSCGHCRACRVGRPNVCGNLAVIGVHRDGGMRELAVFPAPNAIRVPEGLSDRAAVMAEPYSIAANVTLRTEANENDIALIYGAGTVGLTVLQAFHMKQIPCVVTDIDDARLERAKKLGAARIVNSRNESLEQAVREETEGFGVTLVVDGAGAPGIIPQATKLAGPTGRIAVMNFAPGETPIEQAEIVKKELSLVGSRLNRRLIPTVLRWFADRLVDPDALVTHEFRYDQVLEAMRLIEEHPEQTCKVHLIFS